MQSLKKFYFGKQKVKVPNTFIGGIGGTINTPALLASKLGISESRIRLFKVTGVDVECAIVGGSYDIPSKCFRNPVLGITYYNDSEGLVNVLNSECFGGSSGETALTSVNFPKATSVVESFNYTPNLKIIELPKATSITGAAFAFSYKRRIYAPLCNVLGSSNLNNNVFQTITGNPTIYVNPLLQTSNSGAADGDLQSAITQGATIRYVTNFTPPNPVTNLSTGTIYNTAVQLNFTPPTSVNGVDFYECYANGKLMNEIKSSGEYIAGLTASTNYNIRIVAVDMFYNKSELSNTVNVSTTSNLSDTDATAYTTASSNIAYQYAINDLFKGLKDNSLYTKIQAFYPFLGTTAAQHKWNAKNPLDTNAAFRLQFFGGGTHSNLGYQCNGTNAYANTFLAPSTVQNVNSNGLTVTVGTNNNVTGTYSVEIGAQLNTTTSSLLTPKVGNSGAINCDLNSQSNRINAANTTAIGMYTGTKQSTASHKVFKNKLQVASASGGGALPSLSIFVGALNFGGSAQGYSSQRIQFTAIHEGLTDAEVVALHTIIDNFETAIGRKTW